MPEETLETAETPVEEVAEPTTEPPMPDVWAPAIETETAPAAEPTTEVPTPVTEPTPTAPKLWLGATLEATPDILDALSTALREMIASSQPMYLLEVEQGAEVLIALNEAAIALMGASLLESVVPRYFSPDWSPERNLTTERTADEFQFSGALKCFNGAAKILNETHRKIAENLWMVAVG